MQSDKGAGMNKINTGGTAFPTLDEHRKPYGEQGMTLRQYYAAKALAGMCAHTSRLGTVIGFEKIPAYAFQLADAMIEFERNEAVKIGSKL